MVLGTIVPAFAEEATTTAAEMTAGEKLLAYGAIDGTENGLEEERPIKRAEMAVIYAQLNGKIADAQAWAFSPSFTDMEGHWAEFIVAYAEDQGWMLGDGAGSTFRPEDEMSAAEVNVMLMKVLGHPVVWETVTEDAAALGIDVTAADATQVLRGEVFGAMVVALDEMPLGSEVTLGSTLENLTGYEAPEVVEPAVELAVESITALNLKEVEVKFNTEVDETTAETAGNYAGLSNFTAALQADKMTVILTESSTNGAFAANQGTAEVTVSGVEDLAGVEVVEYTETITFFDAIVPEAVSIELTGPNTFEITFSEPVDADTVGTVEVDNGIYGVASVDVDGTATVVVTLSASTLAVDTYDVAVSGFVGFDGYTALAKDFVLDYVADTSAPTATITDATQTTVEITFDKAVTDENGAQLDASYFYHTFTAYNPTAVAWNSSNTVATLDFTPNPLPEGEVKVVVDYDANDLEVEDAWGNSMGANAVMYATIVSDTTAPTVVSVDANATTITITFDEVMVGYADLANYTVLDADEDEVTVALGTWTAADKTYTLTGSFEGTYTIAIEGATDTALEANEVVNVTMAFTVADETGIDLDAITAEYVEGTSDDYVYVTFPEKMDADDILNKANYLINGTALSSDDTVAAFGSAGKQVKITINDVTDFDFTVAKNLVVGRVADFAGNESTKLASGNIVIAADAAPVVTAVKTLSENTIEITVDQELKTLTAAGFLINEANTLAAISWSVNADGETVIVGTLKAADNLASSSDTTVQVDVVGDKLKSTTDKFMASTGTAGTVAADDGYAPSLSAATTTVAATTSSTTTIVLTMDENMAATTLAGLDLVVTYDGTELVYGTEYTANVAGGDAFVTITVTNAVDTVAGKKFTVAPKATINYLTDAAANDVNAFDAKTITVE
jgi:hypothetical protein